MFSLYIIKNSVHYEDLHSYPLWGKIGVEIGVNDGIGRLNLP